MARKNITKSRAVGMDGPCQPCRESTKTVKARWKSAKEDFDMVLILALEEKISYDVRNEVVGNLALRAAQMKREYLWSKGQDEREKK